MNHELLSNWVSCVGKARLYPHTKLVLYRIGFDLSYFNKLTTYSNELDRKSFSRLSRLCGLKPGVVKKNIDHAINSGFLVVGFNNEIIPSIDAEGINL